MTHATLTVRFVEGTDYACELGRLRRLLKRDAGLSGLQVRKKRPHSVIVRGCHGAVAGALMILMNDYAIDGFESDPVEAVDAGTFIL
jgi:hypothetical protein